MKRNRVYLVILFLVLFLIESAMRRTFSGSRILPELLLMLIVVVAVRRSFSESLWLAFFAGFLLEIFSGLVFGSYLAAFVLVALAVSLTTRKLATRDFSKGVSILLVASSSIFFALILHFFSSNLSSFLGLWLLWLIIINYLTFFFIKFLYGLLPSEE